MKTFASILVLLLLVVGTPAQKTDPSKTEETVPAWPAAPAEARIRYVSSLPADLGDRAEKKTGFWDKLFRMAVGLGAASETRRDRLLQPTGLCLQGNRLYVADIGQGRVLSMDLTGGTRAWIPAYPIPRLPSPVAVQATPDGKAIFVSDSEIKKVIVYDEDGKVLSRIRMPEGGRPTGLALDHARGLLYVADTGNHRVEVFNLQGGSVRSLGKRGTAPGEFNYPTYLWVEPATGVLWVSDAANFRLQSFDERGKFLSVQGEVGSSPGHFARPRGVATDSDGNVYAVDAAMEAVQVFNRRGDLLLFFGGAGNVPGRFNLPAGLAMDGQDRLYVADTHNGRVQVFQYYPEAKP